MALAAKRLIVNADDLGRTPGINAGIFEAHRRGVLTSATLMVGFQAAMAAAEEMSRHPDLGVGLHVTLTGSVPLLPPERVPSLVDENGRFPAKPEGHGDLDSSHVAAEVAAQLARFRELTGRLPTHFDSHHHSHRLPAVREALIAAAGDLGIPVRNAGPQVGRRLREAGIRTTDRFVEEFFGSSATLPVLRRIVQSLDPGVTEIMCHPARIDDELRGGSSYVDERADELEVLTDPSLRELIADESVELIHFGAL